MSVDAIIEDLENRVRGAQANERHHKNDSAVVRRELAGYTRGLQDALFAVHLRNNRDVLVRLKDE